MAPELGGGSLGGQGTSEVAVSLSHPSLRERSPLGGRRNLHRQPPQALRSFMLDTIQVLPLHSPAPCAPRPRSPQTAKRG